MLIIEPPVTIVGGFFGDVVALFWLIGGLVAATKVGQSMMFGQGLAFLGGAVAGLGSGLQKSLHGVANRQPGSRALRAKQGNFMRGDGRLARGFNRTTATIGAIPGAGIGLNARRWRTRVQGSMSRNVMGEAAEFGEKNANFAAIKNNDDFLMAGIVGKGNDSRVRQELVDRGYSGNNLEQAVGQIRAARRAVGSEVFETAATLAMPETGTAVFKLKRDASGTVMRDADGNAIKQSGAGEMHELINEVTGNDRLRAATMLAQMRGGAGKARRFDLGGGSFGSQLGTMENQRSPVAAAGHLTTDEATEKILNESLEGQGGSYIAGARTGAVKNFAPVIHRRLETSYNAHIANPADRDAEINYKRELAVVAGRYDAMASVSPDNARVLASQVLDQQLGGQSIQQIIEAARQENGGDNDFVRMRREYGAQSRTAAAASAAGNAPSPVAPVQPPL